MLKIKFNGIKGEIEHPSTYFDLECEDEWFEDDFVKEMIKDIDKCQVISPYNIISPVLGGINYKQLSGGVKNLILAYKTDEIIDASHCGNNCAKWILKIAELKAKQDKDMIISLYHVMSFRCDFKALILNDGTIVESYAKYINKACTYLQRGGCEF